MKISLGNTKGAIIYSDIELAIFLVLRHIERQQAFAVDRACGEFACRRVEGMLVVDVHYKIYRRCLGEVNHSGDVSQQIPVVVFVDDVNRLHFINNALIPFLVEVVC